MKMKILVVVENFVPEIGSAAHLYFDLTRAFTRRGHEVDVITSYPRKFNLDSANADREFPLYETVDGVRVHRCRYPCTRDNVILRGMEHFVLPELYFREYERLKEKFDACLIYMPPLPLYSLASRLKNWAGIPTVLNYQDFHPQELTDVGVLKNKLMIRFLEHLERKSYNSADYITVLSKGAKEYIIRRGGDPSKLEHIYNGCFMPDMDLYSERKDFKEREGIESKILISYAGILSPFQGIDNILDAARELMDQEDIVFCLAGDGMLRDHLSRRIEAEMISNVRLLPLQPRSEYFNIVNSSDISIVSLDERMKAPCLPGKLRNMLAMRQPVIAIVPEKSETAKVIEEAECGMVVNPGEPSKLRSAILEMARDPKAMERYGLNGRSFLEENMDLQKIALRYEDIFTILSRSRTSAATAAATASAQGG